MMQNVDGDECNFYGIFGPEDEDNGGGTRCQDGVSMICLEDVRDDITTTNTILENGDATDLSTNVILSPQEYSTYQSLKEASPYLSEEILEDLIQSSMDDYLKGDILIDNSPLSDAAMVLAGNHTSDFVYQILYTIKYNETASAIQLLDLYMRNLAQERDVILRSLITQELSIQNYNGARNLPSTTEPKAVRYLINQLIDMEQYDLAEEVMDQHLSNSTDDQAFRVIHDFNRTLKEEGRCDLALTEEDEEDLLAMVDHGGNDAAYAKSILNWLYDYEFAKELPIRSESTAKASASFRQVTPLAYQSGIVISPNPANGEAYIHAWQNVQGGSLGIYSLSGERVEEIDLEHGYLNKVNVADLRDGIYIAILLNANGSRIGETKLAVVR